MFNGCSDSSSNFNIDFDMSAVEWLIENTSMFKDIWKEEIKQAKEKERNQIIRAVNYSIMNLDKLREQAIKENVTIGEVYIRIELDKMKNKCL